MTTCSGTTAKGTPCARKAGAYGFCHQHDPLTDKQRAFIDEYMIDMNATQAAIRAGYAENSARIIASQNLSKLNIRQAIDERLKSRAMGADEAVARLANWARGDVSPFVRAGIGDDGQPCIVVDLTTDEARANLHLIKKIKQGMNGLEIELHDAKDATLNLLKLAGKFVDRVEHTGADGGPIQTTRTAEDRKARIAELLAMKSVVQRDDDGDG